MPRQSQTGSHTAIRATSRRRARRSRPEERKARMLEDTREALADIKAGRVADGADVINWLDSWGEDNEKTPPAI